jgi:hypothetical protein
MYISTFYFAHAKFREKHIFFVASKKQKSVSQKGLL